MEGINIGDINIQTHLGIWKLSDWEVRVCAKQLSGKLGVYILRCKHNNMVLIGEGILGGNGSRILYHIRETSKFNNKKWTEDIKNYGKESFELLGIILEEDEIQRKLIENKLHKYFNKKCYNRARIEYLCKVQIDEKLIIRLNNYTKNQRNYIDECWESLYTPKSMYGVIRYKNQSYQHHILMYILNYGDICGISSVVHHKCENKRCVNPKHLELTTNANNTRIGRKCEEIKEKILHLNNLGKTNKEISTLLNINNSTVNKYIKSEQTSKYNGVYFCKKTNLYISCHGRKRLGYYNNETDAAQNRDYFIVKNNLWNSERSNLNFYNIDYMNFTPHKMNSGKIAKNLK